MERHRSWDSVLISIYGLDAHDLKDGNANATKRWKNALHLSMNSAYVLCVRFHKYKVKSV